MANENITPDVSALRTSHQNSTAVLTRALQRLKELKSSVADPDLKDEIQAEIDTMVLELRISKIVEARLNAASVVVKPLDAGAAQKLQDLAATIDQAIVNDAIVSAGLDVVTNLISQATQLRDLIKSGLGGSDG